MLVHAIDCGHKLPSFADVPISNQSLYTANPAEPTTLNIVSTII